MPGPEHASEWDMTISDACFQKKRPPTKSQRTSEVPDDDLRVTPTADHEASLLLEHQAQHRCIVRVDRLKASASFEVPDFDAVHQEGGSSAG
jgi:hypothetical protein